MRNYIPTRNNLYKLPHNTYMQMLYLLRDYMRIKNEANKNAVLSHLASAIDATMKEMSEEYDKRRMTYGILNPYRAFFDYAYYSYMYARKYTDYGASKSAWSLYRSKFAFLLAEKLNLI